MTVTGAGLTPYSPTCLVWMTSYGAEFLHITNLLESSGVEFRFVNDTFDIEVAFD